MGRGKGNRSKRSARELDPLPMTDALCFVVGNNLLDDDRGENCV